MNRFDGRICSSGYGWFRERVLGGHPDYRDGMTAIQVQCLLVMAALALIGFGPLSLTCLIGFYILVARPSWFLAVVRELYRDPAPSMPGSASTLGAGSPALGVRLKTAAFLLMLLILDIAPVPVTGTIGLYVILTRPAWFQRLAYAIYGQAGAVK